MVLLWFGPQDIMQTIPQPCKAWEKPGWGEMGDVSYFPWVFWCWARPWSCGERKLERWRHGREWAGRTSLSSQGLLLLQLGGHRLPAAATTGQGQQDPHCGLGRSWSLLPSDLTALWKEPWAWHQKIWVMSWFCIGLLSLSLPLCKMWVKITPTLRELLGAQRRCRRKKLKGFSHGKKNQEIISQYINNTIIGYNKHCRRSRRDKWGRKWLDGYFRRGGWKKSFWRNNK